ncbi:hypothetical protein CRG98_036021 [Punica granatum]|uniref:Uncharacterized protein n=1 Tax=Punica granatum TaxID=22663 RepID=A0A2I0IHU7_PUNGR|nr:hypothetical protein CRG98_036021 [Punica granatum]
MEQRKGRRLVLFPMPLQGHINPMLQLAQILHSKGFSITVIHTNFNSPNASNYPHFTFHPIPDRLDQSDPAMPSNIGSLLSHLTTMCEGPFEDCLRKLMLDETDEPIGCLVSDALFHFTQDSKLEDPIMELAPLKVKDLPVINTSDPEKLYQLATSMVNSAKNCAGLIFNTFEDLEQSSLDKLRYEFLIPIFPIGPFHKFCPPSLSSLIAHDETCISWLDSISEGVPMICMPCFADQKVNSRFVCDVWQVGVELERSNGLERGKIQRAIRRLFDEKEGEEIRDRMLHLKEKASLCLKQGGSTFQSIGGLADHILSLESLTFSARESTV